MTEKFLDECRKAFIDLIEAEMQTPIVASKDEEKAKPPMFDSKNWKKVQTPMVAGEKAQDPLVASKYLKKADGSFYPMVPCIREFEEYLIRANRKVDILKNILNGFDVTKMTNLNHLVLCPAIWAKLSVKLEIAGAVPRFGPYLLYGVVSEHVHLSFSNYTALSESMDPKRLKFMVQLAKRYDSKVVYYTEDDAAMGDEYMKELMNQTP